MNGDSVICRVIVIDNIGWFNGIIIDYILNRFWWIDVK